MLDPPFIPWYLRLIYDVRLALDDYDPSSGIVISLLGNINVTQED